MMKEILRLSVFLTDTSTKSSVHIEFHLIRKSVVSKLTINKSWLKRSVILRSVKTSIEKPYILDPYSLFCRIKVQDTDLRLIY